MTGFDAYEYVFPLVGYKTIPRIDAFQLKQIYGTAFYLANNNFMVAGHSLQGALEHEQIGLAYGTSGDLMCSPITDHEVVSECDVGFVRADIPQAKALKWDLDELPMLANILTVGFPHALDLEHLDVVIRAFRGYIVTACTYHRLPPRPRCYEVSFLCPRGLSGAPLLTTGREPKVKGVVLYSGQVEMQVYFVKELREGDRWERFESREAATYGIAIQTESLRNINSAILGGSVEEYLKSVDLL